MYTALNFEAETLKDLAHRMADYYWDYQGEPIINTIIRFDKEDKEHYLDMKRVKLFEDVVHFLVFKNRNQLKEDILYARQCRGY